MSSPSHLEEAMSRMQRIVTIARRERAPLTEHEAFEQIVEELELAGFGSPELDAELLQAARELTAERPVH